MKRLNLFLTLSSLTVLLVTIERFSFTTKILLQPYNFFRLHEVVQMSVLILLTILIPFFVLYTITGNLETLKTIRGKILALIFITGIYFNATGNGVHETASFIFNTYCPKNFTSIFCKGAFFNDYYFGNIVYFIGAFLIVVSLLMLERMKPPKIKFTKGDYAVLVINSLVYSFAIIAYAAFDIVSVGFYYVLITAVAINILLFTSLKKINYLPFTLYSSISYTVGLIVSLLIRFHR